MTDAVANALVLARHVATDIARLRLAWSHGGDDVVRVHRMARAVEMSTSRLEAAVDALSADDKAEFFAAKARAAGSDVP